MILDDIRLARKRAWMRWIMSRQRQDWEDVMHWDTVLHELERRERDVKADRTVAR